VRQAFCISKWEVWEAYKRVKANQGAAGVDEQSIADFEKEPEREPVQDLESDVVGQLHSAAGADGEDTESKTVEKGSWDTDRVGSDRADGGEVETGAGGGPTVPFGFLRISSGKSALDAVGQARQRCWRYDWILDLDIKGFFDNIPQDLLIRAVKKHAKEPWMILYIERWLKAPVQEEDGQVVPRGKGTPQGGVISPCSPICFCTML